MRKIISAEAMRELDRLTVESCATPSLLLMEAAANGALNVIAARLKADVADTSFLIFCGAGNNGGDGAGLARALVRRGARGVDVVLLGSVERTGGDARINFEIVQKLAKLDARLTFRGFTDEHEACLNADLFINCDVIVDAIFGTGLSRPASGIHHRVINLINDHSRALDKCRHDSQSTATHFATRPALIVALDLPSGLLADDAALSGACVRADLTVTFTAPKLANVLPPAARFNGELVTVSVGTPDALLASADSQTFTTEAHDVRLWLKRTRYVSGSYKNSHGHALIVAGSRDMNGAPVLCADAAHIAGAGLVTVATPHSAHSAVSSRVHAEVMVAALDEDSSDGAINTLAISRVAGLSERATVICIGSGLSSSNEETTEFVRRVVRQAKIPVILDADGLNAVAPFDGKIRPQNNAPFILTPHEGEMRRLMNTTDKDALANRIQAARDFTVRHKVILVLKGERVIIAAPNGQIFINPFGNPGTGTAGTGDTLAGIITGFLAQEFAREEHIEKSNDAEFRIEAAVQATVAAVYVASLAADFAARETGMRAMRASDIRTHLSRAFRTLDPAGEYP